MLIIYKLIAKSIYILIKLLKLGSGFTWPGTIILKISPSLLTSYKELLPEKIVFITGTNGKTTTTKIAVHLLTKKGFSVITNDSGANLMNGIVSTLLVKSSLFSEKKHYDIGVFEIDELTLSKVAKYLVPNVLVLLNASRDQLDRHWEVDIVLDKWKAVINSMPKSSTLITDATQPYLTVLSHDFTGNLRYFDDSHSLSSFTNLVGSFNAKNLNCAAEIAYVFGISREALVEQLPDIKFAFGRGEQLVHQGKNYQIFLAKNPESLNQNLKMLQESNLLYDSLLFILNDNIPDGHDVSWIYDIDSEAINKACIGKKIFVSGSRAFDMAIRLNYAGIFVEVIEESIQNVLRNIEQNLKSKNIVVLPNYSAMLQIRKVMLGRKIL